MRNTVVHIAGIKWSARLDKAKHLLTLVASGGGIAISADTRDVRRESIDCISLGSFVLRDRNAEEDITELFRFCHFPEWPVQDTRSNNLRPIRQLLDTPELNPNHTAP